jgi:predicted O-methyltransferase YrrM
VVAELVRRSALWAADTGPGRRLLTFYVDRGALPPATDQRSAPTPCASPFGLASMIPDAPTEMTFVERMFLYSLVRGTRPERVLEIGTSQGGSALIIASALEENRRGRVYSVDPMPRIELDPALFHGRLEVVTGASPEAVDELGESGKGPFDFVLIDGIHVHEQAKLDLAASLRYIAPDAYVLLHDSFHLGVSQAIAEVVAADSRVHDCGYVCNTPRPTGDLLTHAGFRLLRVGADVADAESLVRRAWDSIGKPPPLDPDLIDHDIYYCQYVTPCAYCQRQAALRAETSRAPS